MVHFYYADAEKQPTSPDGMFNGLAKVTDAQAVGGLLYGLENNRRTFGVSVVNFNGSDNAPVGYYEWDAQMKLTLKEDLKTLQFINRKFAIPEDITTMP